MSEIQEKLFNLEQTRAFVSATNIVMSPDGQVLLGILHKGVERQIPEGGDYVLIGGANGGLVEMPYNFDELADAHLANIGLIVQPEQCSPFLPVEYDMHTVEGLLKTPFGVDSPAKRVAFDRVVQLTQKQVDTLNMKLQGHSKIAELVWVDAADFPAVANSPDCSFPYQAQHVLQAFDLEGCVPQTVGFL